MNREDFVCKSCSKCKIGSNVDGLKLSAPHSMDCPEHKLTKCVLLCVHCYPFPKACISCILRGGHATYDPPRVGTSLVPRDFRRLCLGFSIACAAGVCSVRCLPLSIGLLCLVSPWFLSLAFLSKWLLSLASIWPLGLPAHWLLCLASI